MQEKNSLKKFHQLTKGTKNAKRDFVNSNLCQELKALELPSDLSQRVKYLMKERVMLIEMIAEYQAELKVLLNYILENDINN